MTLLVIHLTFDIFGINIAAWNVFYRKLYINDLKHCTRRLPGRGQVFYLCRIYSGVDRSPWRDAEKTDEQHGSTDTDLKRLNRHDALIHCWFNVGPASTTLAQHSTNNGSTYRFCLIGPVFLERCADIFALLGVMYATQMEEVLLSTCSAFLSTV